MQMFHPGSWTESELLILSNISTIESCQWEPLLLLGFGQNPFWVQKHQSATVFLIPNNFLWQLSLFHFPETTIFCLFFQCVFVFVLRYLFHQTFLHLDHILDLCFDIRFLKKMTKSVSTCSTTILCRLRQTRLDTSHQSSADLAAVIAKAINGA